MNLHHRPYTDDDLSLLQRTMIDWRAQDPSGTYCHSGDIPHRLYNGNRGIYPLEEITQIYTDDDLIIALLMAYPRESAMDVFIRPDVVEQHDLLLPIFQQGLEILQCHTKDDSDGQVIEIDCVASDVARKELLRQAGFTEKEIYLHETWRSLDNLPTIQLADGFSIRHATMDDAEQLALVHSHSFNSNWTTELYLNEVMLKPGYRPEEEFIVVAPNGEFAAFTKVWIDEQNKVGLFEPVGTHENYRRMGLARNLMVHVMQWMKTLDLVEAEVCHTTSNPASTGLYAHLGFTLHHQVYTWEKQIHKDRS